ncbi:2Fe-2S iron-sulfur cluster-binding protein [Paracoccus sp. (in: a-proteobacteria)]|uniref:2Fe-2S iron-sulfur cluster-binding protein n=1 Tax=Paracoccus sp. TaxID=267 RepID=UPI00289CC468|nr:2Fe-2S iron-sulfur cluster-binding protein [Paracoccus sp. (in: a-proteobacteria)]
MPKISLSDGSASFDCSADDTVLRAALRAGIGMSYSCNVGSCGNCRFELLEGDVTHRRKDAPAYSEKDRARGRWLGCQAVPSGDCQIKFRPDPSAVPIYPPHKRRAELIGKQAMSHDMAEFTFRIEGPTDFLPGQYALLSVPGVEGERVYSMAGLPGSPLWSFQIKRVPEGAATGVLFDQLEVGACVMIDGPYGNAHLRDESPRDIVLLAGGSGLSPMVSIARGALVSDRHPTRRVRLFFGGRAPRDLEAISFLREITDPRFELTEAVSDLASAEGWTGATGFVHQIAEAQLGDRLQESEIYFAGPPAMAQAISLAFHARAIPPDQIHFDEFY